MKRLEFKAKKKEGSNLGLEDIAEIEIQTVSFDSVNLLLKIKTSVYHDIFKFVIDQNVNPNARYYYVDSQEDKKIHIDKLLPKDENKKCNRLDFLFDFSPERTSALKDFVLEFCIPLNKLVKYRNNNKDQYQIYIYGKWINWLTMQQLETEEGVIIFEPA